DRISRELGELERKTDAGVVVKRTLGPAGRAQPEADRANAVLIAEALDHEGIVRSVALALSRLGVNIASMETAAYNAPETGSTLFRLEAQLELPRGLSIDELRTAMQEVARTENLDLTIQEHIGPTTTGSGR